MKIENQLKPTKFVCASCNNTYEILSTMNQNSVSIDVCSGCHPFYVGNTSNTTLRGRVEKLASKFDTAKQNMSAKKPATKKQTTTKSKKIISDLGSL